MKKAQVKRGFLILALAILISSPFVFAGIGEWWNEFTGRATTEDTDVSITLGNTAPVIPYVVSVTGQQPNEGTGYDYYIWFNATDADLVANLDDATAQIVVNYSGTSRTNSSCEHIVDYSTTGASYNCTVHFEYSDEGNVDWTINVSIKDINGGYAQNVSTNLNHQILHAINVTPTTQTWASISTSDTNTTADEQFMNITNSGNDAGMTINVTALNLRGTNVTSEYIYAENFSIGHEDGSEAGCNGTQMSNATSIEINGASVPRGPISTYSGTEQIFWCINELDGGLSSQEYNSTHYGPWEVASHS